MRRRRNSSRSSTGTRRKRTLSGRSLSDYSDAETDILKQDLENHDDLLSRTEEPMEVSSARSQNMNGTVEVTPNTDCDTNKEENLTESSDYKLEVVNFVRDKLYTRFVVSASELRRLFQMHLAQCPPGHILATGVSDKLLEESVLKVGGVQLENQVSVVFRRCQYSDGSYILRRTVNVYFISTYMCRMVLSLYKFISNYTYL